jgi:two-component system, OmpR family, response regulator ChvI
MTDLTDTTMTEFTCAACPFRRKQRPRQLVVSHGRIYWHEQPLKLTLSEYRLVDLLTSPPSQIRNSREIYDLLRQPGFVAGQGEDVRSAVRSLVKRVRTKFRLIQPGFSHIVNYNSFGYAWEEHA